MENFYADKKLKVFILRTTNLVVAFSIYSGFWLLWIDANSKWIWFVCL